MSEDNNTIDDVDDVMGDPYEDLSIEETLNLENRDKNSQEALFYNKYRHILRYNESSFYSLMVFTTELASNYSSFLTKPQREMIETSDYTDSIKKIEKIKAKMMTWKTSIYGEGIQSVIKVLDEYSSQLTEKRDELSNRGDKPRVAYVKIAERIKHFWKNDLKHKKFFYDDKAKVHDSAEEFSKDFFSIFFDFENTRGLKEALRGASDTRDPPEE